MDTRTPGIGPLSDADGQGAAEIEDEIKRIRDNLGELVSEFDQRRRRWSPVRLVGQHRALSAVVGGVVLTGIAATWLAAHTARARKQRSWGARGRRLSGAVRELASGKRTHSPPGLGWRVLTAASTALAAVAARRLARWLFLPGRDRG
jgi:hypothetical protein